jgi:DNA polymerase-3 subunit alpha
MNRRSLESLIKAGALDSYADRGTLLANIERMLEFHRDATKVSSQDSLFGMMAAPEFKLDPGQPVTLKEKLGWEKELLGIYVSGHPLDAHGESLAKAKWTLGAIKEDPQKGLPVILPVLVAEVRTILTKSGDKMAFVKFEDKSASMEGVIFPKLYKEHGAAVSTGICLLVKGTVSNRNGEISLAIENLKVI